MSWIKPEYREMRFGFEVTMYIMNDQNSSVATENLVKKKARLPVVISLMVGFALASCSLFQGGDDVSGSGGAVTNVLNIWPAANGDIENTSSNMFQTKINKYNVADLKILWAHQTSKTAGPGAIANVSATPSLTEDSVFFADWLGSVSKVKRSDGTLVWKKSLLGNDISTGGNTLNYSRNTPVLATVKGVPAVIVGDSFWILSRPCSGSNPQVAGSALGCTDGKANLVALSQEDGSLLWSVIVDTHLAAKITGSVSINDGVVYVPVASWEEDFARSSFNVAAGTTLPPTTDTNGDGSINLHDIPASAFVTYECCSFRGSVVALDVDTGKLIWKKHLSIGKDEQKELSEELRALLTSTGPTSKGPKGTGSIWGVSTYGHAPTIDKKNSSIYVATAETYTAPFMAAECEKVRRLPEVTNDHQLMAKINEMFPDAFPDGVNCANMNEKLKSYGNAIVSLDMASGDVKWAFYARQYDAWVHACDSPNLGAPALGSGVFFPLPLSNKDNCPKLIGPDMGFGQQPMLVKDVAIKGKNVDLVVAANKDGRVFAVHADTGALEWEADTDPGNIYGGTQFGIATDGKTIFVPTNNQGNTGSDVNDPFVSDVDWGIDNGFGPKGQVFGAAAGTFYDLPVGGFVKRDFSSVELVNASTIARGFSFGNPAPGPAKFWNGIFGFPAGMLAGYDPDQDFTPLVSGPKELWTLVNPPEDVAALADGINLLKVTGQNGKESLKTITGNITAIDAATGLIKWQRPLIDSISGKLGVVAGSLGSIAVVDGVVFAGYADSRGTFVALDSDTGVLLKKFELAEESDECNGRSIEGSPAIVDGEIYVGMGAGTGGTFYADKTGNCLFKFGFGESKSTASLK